VDDLGQQEPKPPRSNWGGFRYRRRSEYQVRRLIADINLENHERVRAIAEASHKSIAQCVDEMIEADWSRRLKRAQLLENPKTQV
jgi:hypothetical protein